MSPRRSHSWGRTVAYNHSDLLPDPESKFIPETIFAANQSPSPKRIRAATQVDGNRGELTVGILEAAFEAVKWFWSPPNELWGSYPVLSQVRKLSYQHHQAAQPGQLWNPNSYREAIFTLWDRSEVEDESLDESPDDILLCYVPIHLTRESKRVVLAHIFNFTVPEIVNGPLNSLV